MRNEAGRVAARVRELLLPKDAAGKLEPNDALSGNAVSGNAALRRLRLDPGRRAAAAIGVAVVLAAVLTGLWLIAERPAAVAVHTASGASPPGQAGSTAPVAGGASAGRTGLGGRASGPGPNGMPAPSGTPPSDGDVVVDVVGKVRRPGVYRIPTGSRVDDAVRAAGGALGGTQLESLNLAAKVVDGEQIRVGIPGAAGLPGTSGGGVLADPLSGGGSAGGTLPGAAGGGLVDLNSAGPAQLQTLPGVGPVLAQHILDWRAQHGRFERIDQLNDVAGIGVAKFAALRPHVTV